MSIKNFLISVLVLTSISIAYIFQHTKLLEYGYSINSHQKYMSLLVDQNRNLRYNIAKLETPSRLEETVQISDDSEFHMPQSWYKIKVKEDISNTAETITPTGTYNRMGSILLSMFSFGDEAVANESSE
ncbi:MAG: hypothetical protein ABH843_06720 [Candidatus Omnitrophota bacterium]